MSILYAILHYICPNRLLRLNVEYRYDDYVSKSKLLLLCKRKVKSKEIINSINKEIVNGRTVSSAIDKVQRKYHMNALYQKNVISKYDIGMYFVQLQNTNNIKQYCIYNDTNNNRRRKIVKLKMKM